MRQSLWEDYYPPSHLLRHRADKGDEVGKGERDEVAVGGCVQRLRAPHCHHHHQIARHSNQENARLTIQGNLGIFAGFRRPGRGCRWGHIGSCSTLGLGGGGILVFLLVIVSNRARDLIKTHLSSVARWEEPCWGCQGPPQPPHPRSYSSLQSKKYVMSAMI